MSKIVAVIILFIAAVLIAFADAFIKKAAVSGTFIASLKSPWLYWSVLFYLAQILLVVYLFLYQWKLGILANVFVVFYSILTVVLGYLMFAEKLAPIQVIGIILGISGVFLMTR